MENERPGREPDQSGQRLPILTLSNKAGEPGAEVECQVLDYRVIDKPAPNAKDPNHKDHFEIATVKVLWFKDLPPQGEAIELMDKAQKLFLDKKATPEAKTAARQAADAAIDANAVKVGGEYDLFVGSQLLYKFRANKIVTKEGALEDPRAKSPGIYIVYKGKSEIQGDGEWAGTLAHQWEVGYLKAS